MILRTFKNSLGKTLATIGISAISSAIFLFTSLFLFHDANAQKEDSIDTQVSYKSAAKYLSTVQSKSTRLQQNIDKKTRQAVDKLKRQELGIAKKLMSKDSAVAKMLIKDVEAKYGQLDISTSSQSVQKYIPELDSISSSLAFLNQFPSANAPSVLTTSRIATSIAQVDKLNKAFSSSSYAESFLKDRKQALKQLLTKYPLGKQLKRVNKQVYYYSQQAQSYREMLKDKKKIERKVLEVLAKQKAFKQFMSKHSMLASLFRMPDLEDNSSLDLALAGLQTRSQVTDLIQQRLGAAGPNATQQFNNNMQSAQSELAQLKDKMQKLGAGSSDAEMPEGFTPNSQKTKSFWQRLQYGTNIQSQRANSVFPVTSDIGLSVGYKLNDKSIIGVGTSYKLGWGRSIQNMRITHQGVGLRGFLDWKIKKSIWISGGYEMNYRSLITDFTQLQDYSQWQRSGLIGLSKSIPIKTKFFKNSKVLLLWDFLSYEQRPRTQPIIFRVGYNF